MVKKVKKLKVITKDSLKEAIDEANALGVEDVVQVLEKSTGEFTIIYRG